VNREHSRLSGLKLDWSPLSLGSNQYRQGQFTSYDSRFTIAGHSERILKLTFQLERFQVP